MFGIRPEKQPTAGKTGFARSILTFETSGTFVRSSFVGSENRPDRV
ncbi:hypothetical protein IQ235_09750 [Oscillatoriales cyanobacterium LEGE 11467]|uniref:Uncharacterized protein n=1 Tax=Zarconia navalis LEGE 11467 TaxID=1828826 RepID=A0A928Z741_9CYAN|nr:hypothetical protein [Zarconia navalis]MBE9041062.1 hypothetical protein [Zarconia navalis LEGE 11467]